MYFMETQVVSQFIFYDLLHFMHCNAVASSNFCTANLCICLLLFIENHCSCELTSKIIYSLLWIFRFYFPPEILFFEKFVENWLIIKFNCENVFFFLYIYCYKIEGNFFLCMQSSCSPLFTNACSFMCALSRLK